MIRISIIKKNNTMSTRPDTKVRLLALGVADA